MRKNKMAKLRKCTTMATLRKRCEGSPLIPKYVEGRVIFYVFAANIKGFRYGKHDKATNSGTSLTEDGKNLAAEFGKKIGLEPSKLYSISESADIVERSKEFWFGLTD
jgi:hypothetical protein